MATGFAEFNLGAGASASTVVTQRAKRRSHQGAPESLRFLFPPSCEVHMDIPHHATTVEEYAWEKAYERTWEAVQEDEEGRLMVDEAVGRRRRRRLEREDAGLAVKRRLLRALVVVLDMSEAMSQVDLRPSRALATVEALQAFVRDYFDQNPISYLSIYITSNTAVRCLTPPSSNPKHHIARLRYLESVVDDASVVGGFPSFQLALEAAARSFRTLPSYADREILLVHGSLCTTDPGNIHTTIATLQKLDIRISVISLAGELFISRTMADRTRGSFGVAESADHLTELLAQHRAPRPRSQAEAPHARMERMGFPRRILREPGITAPDADLRWDGFECPRCACRVKDVPSVCPVCQLRLATAPHLARSYHHLFPIGGFIELQPSGPPSFVTPRRDQPAQLVTCDAPTHRTSGRRRGEGGGEGETAALMGTPPVLVRCQPEVTDGFTGEGVGGEEGEGRRDSTSARLRPESRSWPVWEVRTSIRRCQGCLASLGKGKAAEGHACSRCGWVFCEACDDMIHEQLHHCPGCS